MQFKNHIGYALFIVSAITRPLYSQTDMSPLQRYANNEPIPFPTVSQTIQSNPNQSLPIVKEILDNGTAEQQTLLMTTMEKTSISCGDLRDNISSLLRSPYWPVRGAAVRFTRFKECYEQAPLLRELLQTENHSQVAGMTASALSKIGTVTDADLISRSLNCSVQDRACQIQKESALRKLGHTHEMGVITQALQSKDESIQQLALQCFEDVADPEIATLIASKKDFPLRIQWFRDSTVEKIKWNGLLSPQEKENALWNSLGSENPVVVDWAVQTLLNTSSDNSTQQKLMDVFEKSLQKAVDAPASHDHSGITDPQNNIDANTIKLEKINDSPQASAFLGALVTRGLITREELLQKIQQTEMK